MKTKIDNITFGMKYDDLYQTIKEIEEDVCP